MTIVLSRQNLPYRPVVTAKKRASSEKIPEMAGAPSPAEKKRQELIITIQKLHKSGETIKDIAHITGKDWKTVKRYLDGDPRLLCRYDRHSTLDIYSGYIINSIKAGQTASAIARKIKEKGNKSTLTNIRMFVAKLAKEHGLEITKYHCSPSRCDQGGNSLPKMDFITRKGIFNHLWMNMDLTLGHRNYLWMHHESLPQLDKCIREFREIFTKKSIPRLHLFIERYSQSPLKEIASFANGLKKDIEAVENAVASPLSNAFVEGNNSKVKTVKKAMYGRCSKLLLEAKLMYDR